MSKIKIEPLEQQQFGTAGIEGVKTVSNSWRWRG